MSVSLGENKYTKTKKKKRKKKEKKKKKRAVKKEEKYHIPPETHTHRAK